MPISKIDVKLPKISELRRYLDGIDQKKNSVMKKVAFSLFSNFKYKNINKKSLWTKSPLNT